MIELAIRDFSYDPHTKGKPLEVGYIDKMINTSKAIRADYVDSDRIGRLDHPSG